MNETGRAEPAPDEPGDGLFPGDGEMVRRVRAHPWAESGLGDPRDECYVRVCFARDAEGLTDGLKRIETMLAAV